MSNKSVVFPSDTPQEVIELAEHHAGKLGVIVCMDVDMVNTGFEVVIVPMDRVVYPYAAVEYPAGEDTTEICSLILKLGYEPVIT